MRDSAYGWAVRVVLAAVAALALSCGAGCARQIQVLDMGPAESDLGRPTHGRVRVDLTQSAAVCEDESRPPRVRLFCEGVLVYEAEASVSVPVEIVDLDPGAYRLVVERVPDAPHLDVEREFTLAEDGAVTLVYDDRRWAREFWDGVGECAVLSAKVVGVTALIGGCVALDAAIIGGCCCCGGHIGHYTPVTVLVCAALLK